LPTTPTDVQVPSRLPVVPGLVLHGTYLLTDREPINRGDTLDAVVLPDHRLALLVADVVGHGFAASMAATQARTVLRERLVAGAGLEAAAEALDGYLRHLPEIGGVAICAALIDPVTGDVEYVAPGHPGPVVVSPDRTVRRPRPPTYPPLGLGQEGPAAEVDSLRLGPGDLLVLHTDGLIGADADFDDAVVRALDQADRDADPAALVDEFCAETFQGLVPPTGIPDDGVLLGALRVPEAAPLAVSLPARRASIAHVRQALDHWLDEVGAGLLDHAGLVQALDEITTNVVDHAYPGTEGTLSAGARLDPSGKAVVTVTDHGAWPEDAPLGFGLMMAAGLADSFRVVRGRAGNMVELCHELTRPVSMLQAVPTETAPEPDWEADLELETRPGKVSVRGAVDDLSAEIFHAALNEASEAGNRDLTVDLTGVTRLASPGVQSLHEFHLRGRQSGSEVAIVAEEGSCVARVLEITAVPHRTVGMG